MTLRIPAKVLIHVWSYDFYDMTFDVINWRTATSYDKYLFASKPDIISHARVTFTVMKILLSRFFTFTKTDHSDSFCNQFEIFVSIWIQ